MQHHLVELLNVEPNGPSYASHVSRVFKYNHWCLSQRQKIQLFLNLANYRAIGSSSRKRESASNQDLLSRDPS